MTDAASTTLAATPPKGERFKQPMKTQDKEQTSEPREMTDSLSSPNTDTLAAISKPVVESKGLEVQTPLKPATIDNQGHALTDKQADKIALRDAVKEQLEGLIISSQGLEGEGSNGVCKSLEGLLDRVCSSVNPHARARLAKTLSLAMEGKTWGAAMDETGIVWAFIAALRNQNPGFFALIEGVQTIAEQACTRRRLKLADKRAFDGVERVGKGGTTYLEYSDRLAELLIKGDDPSRYNPQATKQAPGSSGGPVAVQININTGPSNSPTIQTSAFTLSNTDNP